MSSNNNNGNDDHYDDDDNNNDTDNDDDNGDDDNDDNANNSNGNSNNAQSNSNKKLRKISVIYKTLLKFHHVFSPIPVLSSEWGAFRIFKRSTFLIENWEMLTSYLVFVYLTI